MRPASRVVGQRITGATCDPVGAGVPGRPLTQAKVLQALPTDLRTVEEPIVEHEVALVVIDPSWAFLDPSLAVLAILSKGRLSEHPNMPGEVRRLGMISTAQRGE